MHPRFGFGWSNLVLEKSQPPELLPGLCEETTAEAGFNRMDMTVRDVVRLHGCNSLLQRREIQWLPIVVDGLQAGGSLCRAEFPPLPLLDDHKRHQRDQRQRKELNLSAIHSRNTRNLFRSGEIASRQMPRLTFRE
jgi:hypothetical protein